MSLFGAAGAASAAGGAGAAELEESGFTSFTITVLDFHHGFAAWWEKRLQHLL